MTLNSEAPLTAAQSAILEMATAAEMLQAAIRQTVVNGGLTSPATRYALLRVKQAVDALVLPPA